MIEIDNKIDCCGCAACQQICPVDCIDMKEDDEGFLYPFVNKKNCVNCGACENVCPIINANRTKDEEEVYKEPKAVGGWIKDEKIRYDSSSGGAFSLFANYILDNNGT